MNLNQFDFSIDRNAYPSGPTAQGRDIYRLIGWEGADRGGVLLSEVEVEGLRNALRHSADPVRDAAPDMLKVLKQFASVFGENLDDPDAPLNGGDAVEDLCKLWPSIKVAILKAEGGAA